MKKTAVNAAAAALALGGLLLPLSRSAIAGEESLTQKRANKDVVAQEAEKKEFPVHVSLTAGYDKDFVFRGVNILPEKTLNLTKATTIAVGGVPGLPDLLTSAGLTPGQFVASLGLPNKIKVARESDLGYFDANVSAYGLRIGAFHALQVTPRIEPNFFGGKSFFDEYSELDAYISYSHAFGPVNMNLGGTYYHVEKNSQFDTAELNFGVSYTPPQFQYVTASFSYDYAGSTKYAGGYFDGHHLEGRIDGNIPVPLPAPFGDLVKVDFNPYILVSAGAGIIPRSFNTLTLPTYFTDRAFAAALTPVLQAAVNGQTSNASIGAAQAAFDPNQLDRDFDLSNFQTGFKMRFYLGKYVTFTGDAAYSRPLGNLEVYPYNQKDVIWGGASVNFFF